MKTILTEKIDGHTIIKGFDRPVIDPVETQKTVNVLITETAEYLAVQDRHRQIKDQQQAAAQSFKTYQETLLRTKNMNTAKPHLDDYNARKANADELLATLIDLNQSLENKRKELFDANAVYFPPKEGEKIVTMAEFDIIAAVVAQKTATEAVTEAGDIIPDLVNKDFWKKTDGRWNKTKITKLGESEPVGSAAIEDLLPADVEEITVQLESDRILALTAAEKTAEKTAALNSAMRESINYRSQLEIQGDADALTKSQAFYTAKAAEIETKYT